MNFIGTKQKKSGIVKRAVCLMACVALASFLLAGCGKSAQYDPDAVVATYADKEILAAEASYYIRDLQYTYEYYYGYYYEDLWNTEIADYYTFEDMVKEAAMRQVYQTYVLMEIAENLGLALNDEQTEEVKAAAEEYVENADSAIIDAVGIDADGYYEIFANNALAMLAYQALIADVDTEVSDQEARACAIHVVALSTSSEDYNAEEVKDQLIKALDGGADISEAAEEMDLTATSYTVADGDYSTSFGEAAMELEEGEYTAVYSDSTGYWYVIYCDEYMNEEATETEKEAIISERESELFEEAYTELKEEASEFKVKENVLSTIDMSVTMYSYS